LPDQPEFREVMLEGRRTELNVGRLRAEVLGEAERLSAAHPRMGALVIECTDLVPFASEIQAAIGRPVFDIVTLTEMVHASLTRHPYGTAGAGPLPGPGPG
jgi:hypothetical protein